MTRHPLMHVVLIALLAGALCAACSDQTNAPVEPTANTAGMIAKTVQRPITDFVSAQGITNYFVPPALDFMGFYSLGDNGFLLASLDYAGVSDRYLGGTLGTTFAGNITERPLPDGRAYVTVNLHTRNTLVYILEGVNGDFATDPLLFGNRVHDVSNGATPALGDVHFEAEFINTAPGAPLPDIMWAQWGEAYPSFPYLPPGYPWPGFEWVCLKSNATADGPLHAAAGLGPDGTPGHARVVQINLRPQAQHYGAHGDLWPAETIALHKRP